MKRLIFFIFSIFFLSCVSYSSIDVSQLGKLPVLYNGRLQPLENIARFSLLTLKEKTTIKRVVDSEEVKVSPSLWLWEVFSSSPAIYTDKIFLIDHIDIKNEFNLNVDDKYFSYSEIESNILPILKKSTKLKDKDPLNIYEKNIVQLSQKIMFFHMLQHTFIPLKNISFYDYYKQYETNVSQGLAAFSKYNKTGSLTDKKEQLSLAQFNQDFKRHKQLRDLSQLYLYPSIDNPLDKNTWANTGGVLLRLLDQSSKINPVLNFYTALSKSYKMENYNEFNTILGEMILFFEKNMKTDFLKIKTEYLFHTIDPFTIAMALYVFAFISSLFYYLTNKISVYSLSSFLCTLAFILHTLGLIIRMYIQGRPPVTNLYSSSVFVGWVAIGLSLLQERIFKLKIGPMISSVLGFITLIIAYHLSLQSDTLEQMQAVLDSNFWLSTHVITITLGYAGTFLAGLLATVYIFNNVFKKTLLNNLDIYKMIYAIICFSLFFSFIGTILGGIWADQSWGRFWGWDPKENGALLIVIWNAIILHARASGVFKQKDIVLCVVFGNVVTAFSWFGVNMLGVGLHSYGFMDDAFQWLLLYSFVQLAIIFVGFNFSKNNSKK